MGEEADELGHIHPRIIIRHDDPVLGHLPGTLLLPMHDPQHRLELSTVS